MPSKVAMEVLGFCSRSARAKSSGECVSLCIIRLETATCGLHAVVYVHLLQGVGESVPFIVAIAFMF